MSIFSDVYSGFTDAASAKIQEGLALISGPRGGSGSDNTGSQLFQAIYEYGRGRVDAATERVAERIRSTSAGQQVEAEVERQRLQELMPAILGIGAVILLAFVYVLRR